MECKVCPEPEFSLFRILGQFISPPSWKTRMNSMLSGYLSKGFAALKLGHNRDFELSIEGFDLVSVNSSLNSRVNIFNPYSRSWT